MYRRFSFAILSSLANMSLLPTRAIAAFYGDGGVPDGLDENTFNTNEGNPREIILDILFGVLSYMAMAAVIVIIIGGIWLVIGGADETVRDRVRKIVLYTIIGLIIIILSSAAVMFIRDAAS